MFSTVKNNTPGPVQPLLLALILLLCPAGCHQTDSGAPSIDPALEAVQADDSSMNVDDSAEVRVLPPIEETFIPGEAAPIIAAQQTKKVVKKTLPRVAIIIDDMGYHRDIGEALLELDMDISFSFLPCAPLTREHEKKAYELGHDVLVHLPMQPKNTATDPGPGALLVNQSEEELSAVTHQLLDGVPHATGANNHMGSLFTEQREAMRSVLRVLRQRGFFFIDSFTSAASTGLEEARLMGIPCERRHIFLDNKQETTKICEQLQHLATLARQQGQAIGIGHPYQTTLNALTDCASLLDGVQVVPVHMLLPPPPTLSDDQQQPALVERFHP
ncbi:MAG: hypothetical protein CSA34_07010 [Desulfobulbus propionicus]|nr:MAG: hypothetical protein CSA34_07010 [Desulfobulbus propionicus]